MPNRSPQPLYIQACGFHSAMGQDDTIIHQCLSGAKPSNMGEPEEVAGLVSYLMSDIAGYVTRQVISVNGGLV